MKHFLYVVILLVGAFETAQASPVPSSHRLFAINTTFTVAKSQALDKQTLNTKIKNIRRLYAHTNNNINHYQMAEFSTYQSAEGGTTKIHTQNKELKKVIETFYGETGKAIVEYYFDDNMLYFVFRQDIHYNVPITYHGFDERKATIEENRYYFDRGNMIKWLDEDKKSVPNNTKRYQDREHEVLTPTTFILP